MPSSLALTEVCVVSLSAMRLTMLWSVAFDQVPCQPAPRNCGSTPLVMKLSICAAVMLAAAGAFLVKPKNDDEGGVECGLGGRAGAGEIVDRLDVGVDAGKQMFAVVAGVEDRGQPLQRCLGVGLRDDGRRIARDAGVSVDRKLCAALEIWPSEFCVDESRARQPARWNRRCPSAVRDRARRSRPGAVRAPSARPMSATRPVETSFCALISSLCVRMQRIAHRL